MTFLFLRSTVTVHTSQASWKYKLLLLLATSTIGEANTVAFL